jgi:CRISPR type III-B/RAMP module-associated protein Cmr3
MTNSPTYNYRIDFRPLDVFFFGSETTFGNGEEVNYFAKSRPYPQQTTILGVLRHLGYNVEEHIGPTDIGESFAAEPDENQGKYGFIEAISPLFFTRRGAEASQQIIGPMLADALVGKPPVPASGTVERWTGTSWSSLFELPAFDPKEWYEQPLLPTAKSAKKLDDLVVKDTRIGITKQRDGQERADGFYKQEMRTLAEDTFFSAYLELAERGQHVAGQHVLPIGAEKALFLLEITKLDEPTTFTQKFPEPLFADCASDHLCCAVLLSDAFVETEQLEKLPFVVADTEDFRYLSTPAKVSDFGRLSRTAKTAKRFPDQMRMSKKYNLLARGSLLYAQSPKILQKILDLPRWQTIGYNHFHLLTQISKPTS